jgi:hypothetical protein
VTVERNEVSLHEVKIYLVLFGHQDRWLSNTEILTLIGNGVSRRTIVGHTNRLFQLRLVDRAEVFPAHRFRWSPHAEQRNGGYARRLKEASIVFGLSEAA